MPPSSSSTGGCDVCGMPTYPQQACCNECRAMMKMNRFLHLLMVFALYGLLFLNFYRHVYQYHQGELQCQGLLKAAEDNRYCNA